MEHGWMQSRVPQDENGKRRLVLKLIAQLRCAECGRLYDPEDFALLHSWQDVWVLSTRCRHCDDSCQIVVFMRLDAEPEPIMDLTPEELESADNWPPITGDDVLDVHRLLQRFDGDFGAIFAS